DHLDFHADMEDYFQAKRRLFVEPADAAVSWRRPERAIVNVDDAYGARLAEELAAEYGNDLITTSAEGDERAQLRALDVDFDATGSSFRLAGRYGEHRVRTALPGRFNVANAITAFALAVELGCDPAVAVAALGRAERVPGRVEPV